MVCIFPNIRIYPYAHLLPGYQNTFCTNMIRRGNSSLQKMALWTTHIVSSPAFSFHPHFQRYPLQPVDSHYTEGSFLPPLVLRLIIHIAASLSPFFVRPIFRWIGGLIISKALDPAIRKHVKMVPTPSFYTQLSFANHLRSTKCKIG